MKNFFLGLSVVASVLFVGCGEGNVVTAIDPNVQLAEDIAIINEYLQDLGYDPNEVDTTETGVRYIILDEGMTEFDSLDIDESDIVDFDYIGRLTNDALFDTSIPAIAEQDTIVYSENRDYVPLTTTFTSTGWTTNSQYVRGFSEGLSASFDKIHVHGEVLIVFPSNLGYGAAPQFSNGEQTIPANSVLTFRLIPVAVVKQ